MVIRNLMVEGRVEPIAVDPEAPIFSFETDRAEGLFVASLFVEGATNAEQERVISAKDSRGIRFSAPLQAETLYVWRISDGKTTVLSHFETALHFCAPMICAAYPTKSFPIYYHALNVPLEMRTAKLAIATSCRYTVFVNDERPIRSPKMLSEEPFFTHDISSLLWRGDENSIRILLETKSNAGVAAEVMQRLDGGRRIRLLSDETWRVKESGVASDRKTIPKRCARISFAQSGNAVLRCREVVP